MKAHNPAARKVQTQVLLGFMWREGTSNIQPPTSNIQWGPDHPAGIGCWMLDVGCWRFPCSFAPPQPDESAQQKNCAGDRAQQDPVHAATLLRTQEQMILDDGF